MPAATLTEPIARTLRRVVGDRHAKLEAAMREVEKLRGELSAIEAEVLSRVDTSRVEKAVDERRIAWESDRENGHKEIDYRLACIILREEYERTTNVRRAMIAVPPIEQAHGELFRRHPDWKKILTKACKARLQVAKLEYAQVEKSVEKELSNEGFNRDEMETHPRIKKARGERELWEAILSRIETDRDNSRTWRYVVGNLFSEC